MKTIKIKVDFNDYNGVEADSNYPEDVEYMKAIDYGRNQIIGALKDAGYNVAYKQSTMRL